MKKNFLSVFAAVFVVVLLSALGYGQNNRSTTSVKDLYVISAKAGGVSLVEGKVNVLQKSNRSGLLLKGDSLEVGETVMTGADGRAEILLNPGSYVRLAENSSFAFANNSLEDLQLKLNHGSAMLEVIADNELMVMVKAPKADFNIVKSGVYRVDVANDGTAKIEVWKGQAEIGSSQTVKVKSGRVAVVKGNQVAVEKFDRDEKDALETWSKSRAKELAKLNSSLQRRDIRNTLINSFNNRGWSMYDSFGLWVYNPTLGFYSFLPFGYGWSSPYGYGYGRDIWYYRLPYVVYNQPPPTRIGTLGRANSSGRGGRGQDSSGSSPERQVIPPFQRIQRGMGRGEPMTPDTAPAPVMMPQPPRAMPMPSIISPSTGVRREEKDN